MMKALFAKLTIYLNGQRHTCIHNSLFSSLELFYGIRSVIDSEIEFIYNILACTTFNAQHETL